MRFRRHRSPRLRRDRWDLHDHRRGVSLPGRHYPGANDNRPPLRLVASDPEFPRHVLEVRTVGGRRFISPGAARYAVAAAAWSAFTRPGQHSARDAVQALRRLRQVQVQPGLRADAQSSPRPAAARGAGAQVSLLEVCRVRPGPGVAAGSRRIRRGLVPWC